MDIQPLSPLPPLLKPLPPLLLSCSSCRKSFLSVMRMNLSNYKTCDACRAMMKLKRENK